MRSCASPLLSLALALLHALPAVTFESPDINEKWKSIPDINKGLNLTEGDIMELRQGSIILANQSLWDLPVRYELSGNLSMNDRGVILRAFEQFRLKSCVDFRPRAAEEFYISVERHEGCWSYIGRSSAGGQTLSIGKHCGRKGIVEHEFLHALGLYHEHTRYDRDDHVTINHQNIRTGYESYLNKRSENVSTAQETPYDYYSVMHFDKNAFSNGNGPTIITKSPELQDVIGQLMEMSEYDTIELNKLYKCNSSVSFLDHCSFDDESLCEMSVSSAADYGWERVKSVSGIDVTDHTYLGKEQNGTSFFMHFSTEGRNEGDAARLESKTVTPTRDCKVQCLQFFYYHSGHQSDQLNIWIREQQNEADSRGALRLMDQITETPGHYWKLHHVPLNAQKSFQVVFEARKGAGNSSGGFSLDDINISETECPLTWQIRDFEKELDSGFSLLWSPLYYSSDGYRFAAELWVFGNQLYIYVSLVSGAYDEQLQWPCPWRQITVQILDQNPHIQKRMSFEQSITTDPDLTLYDGRYLWDKPPGGPVTIGDASLFLGGFAYFTLLTKDDLARREFIKGGDLILLFTMQDISALLQNDSLPCPKVTVKNFNVSTDTSAQQEQCATRVVPTPQPTSTTTSTTTTRTTTSTTTTTSTPTTRTTTSTPTTRTTTSTRTTTTTTSTTSTPTTTSVPTATSTTTTSTHTTHTTPAAEPTERECLDIFCSSGVSTASSLIVSVLCFLLLVS